MTNSDPVPGAADSPDAPLVERRSALPAGYGELLGEVKAAVRSARRRAQLAANTELLQLYWTIGEAISTRQEAEGWGARVLDQLADDLRAEFPDMRGFSRSNLKNMRRAASAWPGAIGQHTVGQLPWGHVVTLLERLDDQSLRDWYAARAVENGWTRKVLVNQIIGRLHERIGTAPSNFPARLAPEDSELAQGMTKDPYIFEFLGMGERMRERDVEQLLMDRLQETLLELGRGFAFVGRQVHLDVEGDDFYVDLLFSTSHNCGTWWWN